MKRAVHLNIRNDEAHKFATELADLTGESLRERLARERRRRRPGKLQHN